ncbi:MAG: class I SAM-dependent methyltransferase [Hyphomicrobiales bacterium]|nr:class I SAM-dependent methyltransferase [Hyphomicrobiales bacterium]MDE2113761.1 class I SAM-dependent methyltransferase [Hyphomicrobiales bacterium]
MSELQRWEDRFSASEYVFGREPNHFLASCASLLPKSGRALAIADGEGRNGVWLATRGLDVHSVDFSPKAQAKARALAKDVGVDVQFELGDAHAWAYPKAAYDVVADIFTQFSDPQQRALKWQNLRQSLKPGGLLIVAGYTPKQLEHGTGGPRVLSHLYTRKMLEEAFHGMSDLHIVEEELEMREGAGHKGMSAVIGLTARA